MILFSGAHNYSILQEQELLVYGNQLQARMFDHEQGSSSLRKSLFGTPCRTVGHCYFDILINGTQVFIICHSTGCLLKYHKDDSSTLYRCCLAYEKHVFIFNINGFVLIFFLGEWSNSDARDPLRPIGLLLVNCDCPFSSLCHRRNAMSNRI